jgi:hypothetical protein
MTKEILALSSKKETARAAKHGLVSKHLVATLPLTHQRTI